MIISYSVTVFITPWVVFIIISILKFYKKVVNIFPADELLRARKVKTNQNILQYFIYFYIQVYDHL